MVAESGHRECGTLSVPIVALICNMLGRIHMPSTVNPYLIGVWFCVGFFTGAGWAVATVIVGRILSAI